MPSCCAAASIWLRSALISSETASLIALSRGVMLSDIPNFAIAIGYTNASWTLKCDLNCHFVTKLLNYMDQKNYTVSVPRFDPTKYQTEPLLDFNSGYVQRAADQLPGRRGADDMGVARARQVGSARCVISIT